MSDVSENGHYVQCPLCEGKGRMKRSELAAALASHELEARLTACRQEIAKSEASQPNAGGEAASDFKDFEKEVLHGPVTRILWRRSAKE